MARTGKALAAAAAWALGCTALAAAPAAGVTLTALEGRVAVATDGEPFTEYVFANTPRPYCYPLFGPGGVPLTRDYPMKETPGEEHDHPHHRSLWFTHGQVNGVDFWSEAPGHGRIEHERFLELTPGLEYGVLRTANRWVSAEGRQVCTDERTFRFYRGTGDRRQIDVEIRVRAGAEPLVFGDTKEGSMALRLNEQMRVRRPGGQAGAGHILNSEGDADGAAWGKRARWCACSGPVDGAVFTVAVLDHPGNPRHPTWWHVREYGLFAANPFGQHDFEKRPPRTGDLTVPAGGEVVFRYRILLLSGAPSAAALDAEFSSWATPAP